MKFSIILFLTLSMIYGSLYAKNKGAKMEKQKIDSKYIWNLEEVYASDAQWEQDRAKLENRIKQFSQYKGHLTDSADKLFKILETYFDISKELAKLYAFAHCRSDEDTRVSKYQAMKEKALQLYQNFNDTSSFFKPETIAAGKKKIDDLIKQNSKLNNYRHLFDVIFLEAKHTLSPDQEKIMAIMNMGGGYSGIISASQKIYEIFNYADFPYSEVTLSNNKKITLTRQAFVKYRTSANQKDRELVFKTFFKTIAKFQRTLATIYAEHVQKEISYTKIRHFTSCLDAALSSNHIPLKVYTNMVASIHKFLPLLHRYLKLKQKMLGLKTLKYSDLYLPFTKSLDKKFSYEEGNEIIFKALAPLGKKAVSVIENGLSHRWAHVFPQEGKRDGAYMDGAIYDVHPYVLLNFNGQYNSVSTTAHEFGHALHSFLSNKNQPYHYADYSIFLAEIASTLNENLLIRYMLKNAKSDKDKLFFIGEFMEAMRTTIFRQAMFAEFELLAHESAEKGKVLTPELLDKIYLNLLKTYYGADKGVVNIEDTYKIEWAYIPHFYYGFYVYQYTTGLISAMSLASNILKQGEPAAKKYLKMLSSGDSDYAFTLLKNAGVDLTTEQPYDDAFTLMKNLLDQAEQIVK